MSDGIEIQTIPPDGAASHARLEGSGPFWLGRDSGCDVVIQSKRVSRRHASLERVDEGIRVSDRSSNGTVLDGRLLRDDVRVVGHTARLRVGDFEIKAEVAVSSSRETGRADGDLRRAIHRRLLDHLDLTKRADERVDPEAIRPEVRAALERIVAAMDDRIPEDVSRRELVAELCDEALGLGPLESLLGDPDVSEIMVVDAHTIFAERGGRLELTSARFTDDESVRAIIERIVTPLGRRIDESTPLVDARLPDGSRVNAVIPPLAIRGPCITIRKFSPDPLTMEDLISYRALDDRMARFLSRTVAARKNIVVSGGTGSGKTTLLNVLSASIPEGERVVTIEDAAELQLRQPHVVSLESRPANMEGKGEFSIRDLVRNALRMRPDRIVVGECRGGEAIDMLQAMNTGHEGSMTTTHANSPREALGRLETLCLMSGLDLPVSAVRRQISASVHLVIQQARFSDGSRRVVSIAEVGGIDDDGDIEVREIFRFACAPTTASRTVTGAFCPTGYLPSFLDEMIAKGLAGPGEYL